MRFARVRLAGGLRSGVSSAGKRLGGISTVIASFASLDGRGAITNVTTRAPSRESTVAAIRVKNGLHYLPMPPSQPLPAERHETVTFAGAALAVLAKDLRIELATREIVTTAGFFAVLVAIMASVAFTAGPETTTRVAPGALWLAIAFSAILALGRSWQREREESALVGLLVSPVPRAAIWFGKAA